MVLNFKGTRRKYFSIHVLVQSIFITKFYFIWIKAVADKILVWHIVQISSLNDNIN